MSEPVEWFRPTSGRVLGSIGLVVAAAVVVLAVIDRDASGAPATGVGALLAAVLIWAAMLRPRVGITPSTLVLRNMVDTVHLPLAAVEQLAVRQFLAVRVGEKRFVSAALGHSWRSLARRAARERRAAAPLEPENVSQIAYPDLVADRIRHAAEAARLDAGVALLSDEQLALAAGVRREPAWPEILAAVMLALLLVLLIAL